ncbi:hypothetical protein C8R46DRAFT_481765 [Mycena filopes]|nr:hypothetical protein C8R46DRAFT_481765 [Mycena filopes]
MAAVFFPTGARSNCVVCGSSGQPVLQRCSGCKFTNYCSSDCQRSDWPMHRGFCSNQGEDMRSKYAESEMARPLLRWMEYWRDPIMKWAAFSADLGNKPADYLANHSFLLVLRVAYGMGRPTPAMYRPMQSEMLPDQAIVDYIEMTVGGTLGEKITYDYHAIPRRDDVVRILVAVGTHITSAADALPRLFPSLPHQRFSNGLDDAARAMSSSLRHAFDRIFYDVVVDGALGECDYVLDVEADIVPEV